MTAILHKALLFASLLNFFSSDTNHYAIKVKNIFTNSCDRKYEINNPLDYAVLITKTSCVPDKYLNIKECFNTCKVRHHSGLRKKFSE